MKGSQPLDRNPTDGQRSPKSQPSLASRYQFRRRLARRLFHLNSSPPRRLRRSPSLFFRFWWSPPATVLPQRSPRFFVFRVCGCRRMLCVGSFFVFLLSVAGGGRACSSFYEDKRTTSSGHQGGVLCFSLVSWR